MFTPRKIVSTALMLAFTTPFLPTVTRLPGMLMLPSILPSMNSDSVPVISPLMERPLLMEACSPTEDVAAAAGREGSMAGCTGVGRMGSGVVFGFDWPCWVGFHIALKTISFSVLLGPGFQGRDHEWWTRKSRIAEQRELACGVRTRVRSMTSVLLGHYQAWLLPLL